jgi:hypothetical protein
MDRREFGARDAEVDRLGAGRQQQRPPRMPGAVRELHLAGLAIDGNSARAESKRDLVLGIEFGRAQRQPFRGRVAGEIIL